MSDNKTWVKAFKGFDKDLKCKGRQYTEGVEDHVSDVAKLCEEGVHACERPLDVFSYYTPDNSVYHEVELAGVSDERKEDSKICGTDIKVKGKLNIAGLVKAQIEYTKSHCTNEYNAENGKPATAGNSGAATAGNSGAATAGNSGAATAGYRGAATAGNSGAATAGDYGAATAGYCGAATSRGKSSVGENGIACSRSKNARVKGGMGAILVCAQENKYDYNIKTWAAGVVDGVNILPDIWYKAENGKLVPADDKTI